MNVIPYSRGVKRSRTGRSRPRMAVARVPRAIRYNGENKITRVCTHNLRYTNLGWTVGAGTGEAINLVFDSTGVTFYVAALSSVFIPLPNAAELAALYDLVRIDKVEISMGVSNQSIAGTFSSNAIPARLIVCNDDNDGAGTATLAQIQQQPNKSFYSTDGTMAKWTCFPKYQRIIYYTSLVSSYEPTRGFVNTDTAIPHYGTRVGLSNLSAFGATNSGNVDFSFKFFLTLKNVK